VLNLLGYETSEIPLWLATGIVGFKKFFIQLLKDYLKNNIFQIFANLNEANETKYS